VRNISLLVLAVALGMMQVSAAHASIAVPWTGSSDGDSPSMSIGVTPFVADTLTLITGGGYSHNHGSLGTIFGLDIHLNGSWVTISSWTQDGNDHLLSERTSGGAISFALGTIDGLRLTDVPTVGNGFHGMYSSYLASGTTTFNFDTTGAVPEATTVAVWGLLSCTGAVIFWRRRDMWSEA
jgi:hypothetical protein